MAMNKKHSYQDYNHQSFVEDDTKDWDNSEVIGTCFHQDDPDTVIFPAGMTGVTFSKCNLDNCRVPAGNTVITEGVDRCCHRWIATMTDGGQWVLDSKMAPIEPTSPKSYDEFGL